MTWLEFSASVIQSIASLAWPAAMVAALAIFREELKKLLPNFHLKYGDAEIDFRLRAAAEEAAKIEPGVGEPTATSEEATRFEQLAALSPEGAVVEAWSAVETALEDVANHHLPDRSSRRPSTEVIRYLRQFSLIDATTAALLDDLRAIRNTAAHRPREANLTKDQALDFRIYAERVISALHSIRDNQ